MTKKTVITWAELLAKIITLVMAILALYSAWGGKERTDTAYSVLLEAVNEDMDRVDDKFDRYFENQAKIRESLAALTEAVSFLKQNYRRRSAPVNEAVRKAETAYLSLLLEETRGRIGETAKRAGILPRSLFEKMRRYGLKKEDYRSKPRTS